MGVAGFLLPPDDFEVPDNFKVFKDSNDFNVVKDISVLVRDYGTRFAFVPCSHACWRRPCKGNKI